MVEGNETGRSAILWLRLTTFDVKGRADDLTTELEHFSYYRYSSATNQMLRWSEAGTYYTHNFSEQLINAN